MAIPSKEYWAERAIQREQESAVYGARATAKLFQEYQKAAREIQKEIGAFYAKYGNKYGLSYEDAVRLLTKSEFRDWKGTLADYMERIAQEPDERVKALLTAQLDALSANSQISRLEALQGQIDLILGDLYDRGVQQLRDEFGAEIIESYYKKSFDIQSRAGFYNEIAKIDAGTIEDIVTYPWSGANFSERLWRNTNALIFKSREILTQGLIQGKSVATMSKQLSDQMGQSFRAAHRLIITETTHFHNAADLRAYEENGTEWYEFVANNDEKTCEVCGALAGKRFRRKDAVEGTNYPVMHPNCHCVTVAVFPDIDEILAENGDDPRTRHQSYKDWYDEQTAKNGQGSVEIERKKWYNKAADREQFDAYRTVLPSSELPDTFEGFQNLKYGDPEQYDLVKAKVRLYNKAARDGALANADIAATPEDKLRGYLLNHEHPVGKDKAHVIKSVLGYSEENWGAFSDKLFAEIQKSPAVDKIVTTRGTKYTVPVVMYGETGKFLRLNTVWQYDNGSNIPRFITATFEKKKKRK